MPTRSISKRHPVLVAGLALGLGLTSALPVEAALQPPSNDAQPSISITQLWGHLDRSIVERSTGQRSSQHQPGLALLQVGKARGQSTADGATQFLPFTALNRSVFAAGRVQ